MATLPKLKPRPAKAQIVPDAFAEHLVATLFAQFVDNRITEENRFQLLERLANECMRQASIVERKLKDSGWRPRVVDPRDLDLVSVRNVEQEFPTWPYTVRETRRMISSGQLVPVWRGNRAYVSGQMLAAFLYRGATEPAKEGG